MLHVEGPVSIHMDKRKALHALRLRSISVSLILLLWFVMISFSHMDAFMTLFRWCLLVEVPILYFFVARNLSRQTKPVVALSFSGLTVNTLGNQIGYLKWEEIKDVYVYNFGFPRLNLGFRFLGIHLNDPGTVYRRIGLKRSLCPQMNGLCIPLYKPFRIRVAPINISDEFLPMSADELLAQIKMYRSAYS
jgi:hypothetical protein